jgi:hypothetical protein
MTLVSALDLPSGVVSGLRARWGLRFDQQSDVFIIRILHEQLLNGFLISSVNK